MQYFFYGVCLPLLLFIICLLTYEASVVNRWFNSDGISKIQKKNNYILERVEYSVKRPRLMEMHSEMSDTYESNIYSLMSLLVCSFKFIYFYSWPSLLYEKLWYLVFSIIQQLLILKHVALYNLKKNQYIHSVYITFRTCVRNRSPN